MDPIDAVWDVDNHESPLLLAKGECGADHDCHLVVWQLRRDGDTEDVEQIRVVERVQSRLRSRVTE